MKTARWWKSTVWAAVLPMGILLAAALAGCGGSASTGGGSTAVQVTIGTSAAAPATAPARATPRPMAATIPSTVTAIRFTVSGEGFADIVRTVPAAAGTTMTVTLQVPNGPGRAILVEALDPGGISHYHGSTVIDATGISLSVTIGMAVAPSNPALQTWTLVDNTSSFTLSRIVQGDGILVTAGDGGEILSSLDGISWISRTSRNILGDISALAFGDHTFLAMTSVGNFTAAPLTYTNQFFGSTSDNVADWTVRGTIGTVYAPLEDVAFGGGAFVAVGGVHAFYSLDNGATWDNGTIAGADSLYRVTYGNGRFVAINRYSDNVAVSTNGAVWTTTSLGMPLNDSLRGIRFGGGLFLAATSAGNIYTSADGVTWQPRTPIDFGGIVEPFVSSVAYGGNSFLVVVSYSLVNFTFDQGIGWTPVDLGTLGSMYDGTYFNGAFLLVGYDWGSGRGGVFRSGDL